MAEEPGEPSDGMTQPSREKPQWGKKLSQKCKAAWRRCKEWMGGLPLFAAIAIWAVLGIIAVLVVMAVAWPIVKAVRTGKGFPSYDIICIGGRVICGMLGARLCGYCGCNIARLIKSASGGVAVCLKKPICWASVMIAASCGSARLMLSLSSLTAFSLSSSWPWIWRVLLLGLCVFVLSVVLRLLWQPAKEWMGGLPLFAAIAIWAGIAIGAFLLAMWWLGRVPFWQLKLDPKKQAENIVKIALTLVGGVGAVAYLVIKYQERQQAGRAEKREKDRTVDTKVQAAINQLGSDKASTRIAGVYALTDIADTYRGGYRQRVVDILCGYLRSDRANYALNELGQPVKNASGHLVKSGDSDEAVESTILSVMHDRLRKKRKDKTGKTIVRQTVDDDQLWCDCEFDLHEATFHEVVDLTYSTFECIPNFRGTKFEHGDFRGADFAGNADFGWAHFASIADFRGADFAGNADFGWADFAGVADFGGATFTRDANFDKVTFTLGAYFTGAEFRASAAFSVIRSQLSFNFEACKFNERFRDAYEWRPIPIPEDNDGLPAGAVWKDFQEEDDKDGGTTTR